jgi:hypothetical protein
MDTKTIAPASKPAATPRERLTAAHWDSAAGRLQRYSIALGHGFSTVQAKTLIRTNWANLSAEIRARILAGPLPAIVHAGAPNAHSPVRITSPRRRRGNWCNQCAGWFEPSRTTADNAAHTDWSDLPDPWKAKLIGHP